MVTKKQGTNESGNRSNVENVSTDISDSSRDRERLQPDEATLNLPEVNDIPGQENVDIPPPHSLGDETIASDDEEGRGLFEDEDDELDK